MIRPFQRVCVDFSGSSSVDDDDVQKAALDASTAEAKELADQEKVVRPKSRSEEAVADVTPKDESVGVGDVTVVSDESERIAEAAGRQDSVEEKAEETKDVDNEVEMCAVSELETTNIKTVDEAEKIVVAVRPEEEELSLVAKEPEPEVFSEKCVEEKLDEPPKMKSSEKSILKKFRKQKKSSSSTASATAETVPGESNRAADAGNQSARTSVEEEEFENMGYVSGDDTTNYADETYPKELNPVKEAAAFKKLARLAESSTPLLTEKKAEEVSAPLAPAILTTEVAETSEMDVDEKVDCAEAEKAPEKEAEPSVVEEPAPELLSKPFDDGHGEDGSGKEGVLAAMPQADIEVDRPSCALENVQLLQPPQHMATTDTTQSLGVYTPDSATNSVHSIHAGYGGGEIGSSESMHAGVSTVMESPNSISSVEAVSLPLPSLQQQQQQQQQMAHPQPAYSENLLSQQQQSVKQSLVPPPFVGYGTPGPHNQVPTPPSPSINHASQQQQQQQQLSSPLMSAAPSPHQSQSLASASPHSQHNMTSPHPQPSPLSSPHPMTISPAAHSPYAAAHVPQPSPQGPQPSQQQSQVRQATRSPATMSAQHQPSAAANQMHQFQQFQRNLWQNYNPMNMAAAAMGMSQQAACHLNRQLAAANFQAGAGMFPPTFTPPSMGLTAPGIAAAVSSSKQHQSSHVGHHSSMTAPQGGFYGQMPTHQQAPSSQPGRPTSAAAAAGCLAKLQQLTNGLESPSGVPQSANQMAATGQVSAGGSSGRSASSKQSSRSAAAAAAAAEHAARNAAAEHAARNAAAEHAARNAAALIPSSYPGYPPTSHQAPNGPTPPPASHTPNAGGYYGRPDMSRASSGGHATPSAPPIPANHLMQPYGQNHHHMLNYTAGYGFINQYMYHAAAASDHQRNSAATPQPGHGPAPPHHQHMYPGYPLGYPANYHR